MKLSDKIKQHNRTYGPMSCPLEEWMRMAEELEQQNTDLARRLEKWNKGYNSLRAINSHEEMKELEAERDRLRTDKDRMDFLESQKNWTRWVGYDKRESSCTWPVFSGTSFRIEVDKAMQEDDG